MINLKVTALFKNSTLEAIGGTTDWAEELDQSSINGYRIINDRADNVIIGLINNNIQENDVVRDFRSNPEILLAGHFQNISIIFDNNEFSLNNNLTIFLVRQNGGVHNGRVQIKLNGSMNYNYNLNDTLYEEITELLKDNADSIPCWFAKSLDYDRDENKVIIEVVKVDDLPTRYLNSQERTNIWNGLL